MASDPVRDLTPIPEAAPPGAPRSKPALPSESRLISLGTLRSRWLPRLVATGFILQFVALDMVLRGPSYLRAHPIALTHAAQSALLWSIVWSLRGRRSARFAGAFLAAIVAAVQITFFRYYHGTIDLQVVKSAVHCWADVWPVLVHGLPQLAWVAAPVAAVEYLILRGTAEAPLHPMRATATLLASILVTGPLQPGPPDLSLFDSMRILWQPVEAARVAKTSVPPLASLRTALPNVLFIVDESVRASEYCSAPSDSCPAAPRTNALLPERIPLHQTRSVGSYTAIAVSALLTGRLQVLPREEVIASPMLFDYARATSLQDARYTVAYWTSHASGNFERDDVPQTVDRYLALEIMLGRAVHDDDEETNTGVDRLLGDNVVPMMATLPTPAFVVLQFGGTHAPYYVDEADAPFTPWQHEVTWAGLPALKNAYRNAIHDQDKHVARCVEAFLKRVGNDPWIVVFTSDHGEAFGEHAAIHHGQNLYNEQIHVPAFVAQGNGALSERELANVASWKDQNVTHLDFLPTLLDMLGVLDAFAMNRLRSTLLGRSLIRPYQPMAAPIPISNCTGIFTCPLNTWGILFESTSLQAQAWDSWWRCVDLRSGAELEMARPDCLRMQEASHHWYSTLPGGLPNR